MPIKNTPSLALGEHFRDFAKAEEDKLEALRKAIQDGIDSGPSEAFDFDNFLARKRDRGRPPSVRRE